LLSVENVFDNKKFKSLDHPTKNLTVVFRDILYEEIIKHDKTLKKNGIVSIIPIKSSRIDSVVNCVRAICENETKMLELLVVRLKINYCIR
jgi:hypothetical protein